MSLPLVYRPEVRDDVDEAYAWYERQQTTLGDDFLAAVREALDQVRHTPLMHRLVYRDIRRSLTRRFPYGVYYRVQPHRIEVIAVTHTHRHPRVWQSRA